MKGEGSEMKVKAIEFVMKYETYVKEIEAVVRPEFKSFIQKMLEIDSHDLIRPEAYFEHEGHAEGFVWKIWCSWRSEAGTRFYFDPFRCTR